MGVLSAAAIAFIIVSYRSEREQHMGQHMYYDIYDAHLRHICRTSAIARNFACRMLQHTTYMSQENENKQTSKQENVYITAIQPMFNLWMS